MKKASPDSLQTIPGIGPSLAQDLRDLGMKRPSCLKNENPEHLYRKLEKLRGTHIDRCVLYTFRCAVYYASHQKHDQKKLLWWNWSDAKIK
jgi:hypothetical protein